MSDLSEFTAVDRSDCCGVRSSVRIVLNVEEGKPSILEFCSHHGRGVLGHLMLTGTSLKDVKFSEDFADAGQLFPLTEIAGAA